MDISGDLHEFEILQDLNGRWWTFAMGTRVAGLAFGGDVDVKSEMTRRARLVRRSRQAGRSSTGDSG